MLLGDPDDDALRMARVPTVPACARKLPGPKYALSSVLAIFRLASIGRQRATRHVVARLGVGEPEAEAFIRQRLAALGPQNYVGTYAMEWDETIEADVYGVIDEHGGWYIKFYVEHGRVQVASFHEPERDLVCVDGTIVKGYL